MIGVQKSKDVQNPLNSIKANQVNRENQSLSRWLWFGKRHHATVHSNPPEGDPPLNLPLPSLTGTRGQNEEVNLSIKFDVDISEEGMLCSLCLQNSNEWFRIEECGCLFCQECMEMYVNYNVKNGFVPILCPDGLCPLAARNGGQLSENEIRILVPSLFPLFTRLLLGREVAINPDLMWCPRPGCETICSVINSDKNSLLKLVLVQCVTCTACKYKFCSQCQTQWHSDHNCQPFKKQHDDQKRRDKEQNDDPITIFENVKRCPFCKIPIERDEGCAQMMCKNCRHVFCWFCLTSLDEDFMLRHYDSGPCRKRLGHSRISVVWHRTQVVSVFFGLGVLFLVTSPLILLASPCLLCWRNHHKPHSKSE